MGDSNIYTVDENGNAVMRVTTEPATVTDPTSIYGTDENGDAAVRVMGIGGGGGGDGNYNNLTNKPKINGVTLRGDVSLDDLGIKGSVQIEVAGTTVVEGYAVPNPTAEEMTAIYNAIVAGNNVQIVDSNDVYYQVLQADSIGDAINVEILFFNEMGISYSLENNVISIASKKLGGGEIDDSSTANNKTWSASKLNSLIGNTNAFHKIEKQADYLYNVIYNRLNYNKAYEYMAQFKPTTFNANKLSAFLKDHPQASNGACSAIRKGAFFGKNLDWYYSDLAEFVIFARTADKFRSMGLGGNLSGLTNDVAEAVVKDGIYNEKFDILPFTQNGGINENKVFVTTNVVPIETEEGVFNRTTGTHEGEGKQDLCGLMIPRVILDNCSTAREAVEMIADDFNVFMPYKVDPSTGDYVFAQELHYIVGDETETYLLEFLNNEAVYTLMPETVVSQNSKLPYMTNFHLTNVQLQPDSSMIDWNTVEAYGQGLERFDTISSGYDGLSSKEDMQSLLQRIKFTKAYTDYDDVGYHLPKWKTEFTGNFDTYGSLTISDTQVAFREIFADVEIEFANRDRTTAKTWQTEHTEVYVIPNGELYVNIQEDYGTTYAYDLSYEIKDKVEGGVKVVDELPAVSDAKEGLLYLVNKPQLGSYEYVARETSGAQEIFIKLNDYMGATTTATLNTSTWCYDVRIDMGTQVQEISLPLFLFDYEKIMASEIRMLFEVVPTAEEADFHCFYTNEGGRLGNNMIIPIDMGVNDIAEEAYYKFAEGLNVTVDTERNVFIAGNTEYKLNEDEYACWDVLYSRAMGGRLIPANSSDAVLVANHKRRIKVNSDFLMCYAIAVRSTIKQYGSSALLRGSAFDVFNRAPQSDYSFGEINLIKEDDNVRIPSKKYIKEMYSGLDEKYWITEIPTQSYTTDASGHVIPTLAYEEFPDGFKAKNMVILDLGSSITSYFGITVEDKRDDHQRIFYFSAPDYTLKYTLDLINRTVTAEAI